MKVLIVNGSPRKKGNTSIALKEVERLTKEKYTEDSVEVIQVYKHNISACMACEGCKNNGGKCVMQDDSLMLMEKVAAADLIIIGTPVYWWGMSAQTKLFVDKFYSKDGIFQACPSKKLGVISIGGADLDDIQYQLIKDQFKSICDYLEWDMIFSKSFSFTDEGEILNSKESLEELKDLPLPCC